MPIEESEARKIGATKQYNRKMVIVDGDLYYNAGEESEKKRCGTTGGKITVTVDRTQVPQKDGQLLAQSMAANMDWARL